MRISVVQTNPVIGDVSSNVRDILAAMKEATESSDVLLCPELSVTGYPPKDLLEYSSFLDEVDSGMQTIQSESAAYPGLTIVVGAPVRYDGEGIGLHNAACVIRNGDFLGYQAKQLLPTYDVFDERRYFDPGTETQLFDICGQKVGIAICEDAWALSLKGKRGYSTDPLETLVSRGAEQLFVIMASPFELGKTEKRVSVMQEQAKRLSVPIAFVNQVGGVDDLVFDGGSASISSEGDVIASSALFSAGWYDLFESEKGGSLDRLNQLHQALVLGVRDYVTKSGFGKVVLGLSGGIDSALVATLAVDALGPESVLGVALPSPYSSEGSITDAHALADNLGIEIRDLPIASSLTATKAALETVFVEPMKGLTEENLQARLRGNLLMALSNQENRLLLTTGNKSELAVGYCTLYGDMNGGFAPISDLPKTMVYELSRWLNRQGERIPLNSIEKPPSAELRPDQKDQDTLPDYEVLDGILDGYIVEKKGEAKLIADGYDPGVVQWVVQQVKRNEYKRFQAAPGLKVTSKAFGSGRKMVLSAV